MKMFKRLLFTVAVILGLLIFTPLVLIQFGPAGWGTTSKVMLNMVFGYGGDAPSASAIKQRLEVADGFSVGLYATGLGKIRFLKVTDSGDLLVSRPRSGEILLLERDRNGDGLPDGQRVLLAGLTRPHGLDIAGRWLYVAESDGVGKIAFNSDDGAVSGDYQRIVSGLGDKGNHWTKTVRASSDGWLYLSSGSTCNVCEEADSQRATIMRFRPDGSEFSIYASGLRNSVGLDWAPWDNSLYATDNGRDLLGDDIPPCELNRIEEGGFYGWPYVNASALDPDLGELNASAVAKNIPPTHEFRAHNAPLGLRFLRRNTVAGFERAALVALHGSWNRSVPDGYKVVSLHWQADGRIVEKDFLSGFLQGDKLLGRPVDIAEGDNGDIFISDDYSGSIYRVAIGEGGASALASVALAPPQPGRRDSGLASYTGEQRRDLLARGEIVYQSYPCSSCHVSGKTASAIPLVGLDERYTVAELAAFFTAPTPPMPVFPLSASDREALAVYLLARP
ncbi:PQQ-dependent sugar dehydrogenase [Zhongshania sp.]|jgi:glucose/arabinose dehydrogenase|uniref:PQQ-dependent sugar dehydrogenase n=1 Tax=Zhongshania sp. TaxID=1971902 RepID=UPI002A824D3B|nr:PQQ-dependent sugar dehydrogenase [Zhongshania sp.]